MFVLDTFLHWVLATVATAAEAEMHDDTALRERLLEAEMRRELGEISDEAFAALEADLLARIRAITAARRGAPAGGAPAAAALGTDRESRFAVEASVVGDFHAPDSEAAPVVPRRHPAVARTTRGRTTPGRTTPGGTARRPARALVPAAGGRTETRQRVAAAPRRAAPRGRGRTPRP